MTHAVPRRAVRGDAAPAYPRTKVAGNPLISPALKPIRPGQSPPPSALYVCAAH